MSIARPPRDGPPAPARDTIEDVQLRGVSRWSPRRAGLPAVLDWWPAYFLVAALGVLVVLVIARLAIDVLAPFSHALIVAGVALVLTVALAPLVGRLQTRMPRRIAAAIVFFGTIVVLIAIGALLVWQMTTAGPRFTEQLDTLGASLEGRRAITIGPYALPDAWQNAIRDGVAIHGPRFAENMAGLAVGFVTTLVDLAITLVVTFYLLLDARRFRVVALRAFAPERRPAARRVFVEVARVVGGYVRAQLTVAVSMGLLVTVAMLLLGVPYALFLGIFAALAELIPMVGPIVAAIPALAVSLSMPFPAVVWVAIAFLLIQQFESNVLLPRLSARATGIHPVASLLALVVGFEVGGVVGALFAVPVAGLLWVLVSTALNAWRGKRFELHRRLEEQATGKHAAYTRNARPATARGERSHGAEAR